jgi:hypothetical protein
MTFTLIFSSAIAFADAVDIPLSQSSFKEVTFEDIPPTAYAFKDGSLSASVNNSSSFLLLPFDKVTELKGFSFQWKKEGAVKVSTAEQEQSKKGDDFYFRLGLILSGEAPFIPFFAPSWIKAIRDHAKLPSDRITYYVVGAKSAVGSTWKSPYSGSIDYFSVASTEHEEWNTAELSLKKNLKVVGLWLMADGDNSKSKFEVHVKQLKLITKGKSKI